MRNLKHPIVWLPFHGDDGTPQEKSVEIQSLDASHVAFWHSEVQPLIDDWYPPDVGSSIEDSLATAARADVGWNWWNIAGLALAHNAALLSPFNQSGSAVGWCVALTLDGYSMPVGMLTVVPSFYCDVLGETRDRCFVWYLSDAPGELYAKFGLPEVSGVASALIDTAIQSRLDFCEDAETLLHADPAGGEKLQRFYRQHCGMTRVDNMSTSVSLLRKAKAAQYF